MFLLQLAPNESVAAHFLALFEHKHASKSINIYFVWIKPSTTIQGIKQYNIMLLFLFCILELP